VAYIGGGQADPIAARLLDKQRLSQEVFLCVLERPAGFSFIAGQSIRVRMGGVEREYSLASGPRDPTLTLLVRMVPGGRLTPRLLAAEKGGLIDISGPHGFFTFRQSARPAVLAATGTGIAPLASMVRDGAHPAVFLHGVTSAADLYAEEDLRRAADIYVPCLSSPEQPFTVPRGFPGRLTRFLSEVLAPGLYDFYLSGRREMIRDATLIVDERHRGSFVYTEIFW
jgi:benzoate/toluate 1,2-dioxygenase reductase component